MPAGLPDNAVHHKSADALAAVDAKLAAFNAGGPARAIAPEGARRSQWLRFLNGIPRTQSAARPGRTRRNAGSVGVNQRLCPFSLVELAIANRYEPALPSLRQFAGTVGRGLLIRPLYTGLKRQGAWGDAIARDLFARSRRATYHSRGGIGDREDNRWRLSRRAAAERLIEGDISVQAVGAELDQREIDAEQSDRCASSCSR